MGTHCTTSSPAHHFSRLDASHEPAGHPQNSNHRQPRGRSSLAASSLSDGRPILLQPAHAHAHARELGLARSGTQHPCRRAPTGPECRRCRVLPSFLLLLLRPARQPPTGPETIQIEQARWVAGTSLAFARLFPGRTSEGESCQRGAEAGQKQTRDLTSAGVSLPFTHHLKYRSSIVHRSRCPHGSPCCLLQTPGPLSALRLPLLLRSDASGCRTLELLPSTVRSCAWTADHGTGAEAVVEPPGRASTGGWRLADGAQPEHGSVCMCACATGSKAQKPRQVVHSKP